MKKGLTSHYFYDHLCLIEGALPASARTPACRLHAVATQENAKSGGSAGFLYVCNLVCRGQRCTFCCLLGSHLFCIVRDWTYISGTSCILLVPFWGFKEFQCSSRKDCWCSVWLNLLFGRSPWKQGRREAYMLLYIHNKDNYSMFHICETHYPSPTDHYIDSQGHTRVDLTAFQNEVTAPSGLSDHYWPWGRVGDLGG